MIWQRLFGDWTGSDIQQKPFSCSNICRLDFRQHSITQKKKKKNKNRLPEKRKTHCFSPVFQLDLSPPFPHLSWVTRFPSWFWRWARLPLESTTPLIGRKTPSARPMETQSFGAKKPKSLAPCLRFQVLFYVTTKSQQPSFILRRGIGGQIVIFTEFFFSFSINFSFFYKKL